MPRSLPALLALLVAATVLVACGSEPPPPPPPPEQVETLDPASPEHAVDRWLTLHTAREHAEAHRMMDAAAIEAERAMPDSVIRALEEGQAGLHSVRTRQVWLQGNRARVALVALIVDEVGRPEPWSLSFELRRDAGRWTIIRLTR